MSDLPLTKEGRVKVDTGVDPGCFLSVLLALVVVFGWRITAALERMSPPPAAQEASDD